MQLDSPLTHSIWFCIKNPLSKGKYWYNRIEFFERIQIQIHNKIFVILTWVVKCVSLSYFDLKRDNNCSIFFLLYFPGSREIFPLFSYTVVLIVFPPFPTSHSALSRLREYLWSHKPGPVCLCSQPPDPPPLPFLLGIWSPLVVVLGSLCADTLASVVTTHASPGLNLGGGEAECVTPIIDVRPRKNY